MKRMNGRKSAETRGKSGTRSQVYMAPWNRDGSEMVRSWLLGIALLLAIATVLPGAVAMQAMDVGGPGASGGPGDAAAAVGPSARLVATAGSTPTPTHVGTSTTSGNATATDADVTVGESVAGALTVQGADVERELESRTFQVRLAVAGNTTTPNASRGALLAAELRSARFRLRVLEDRMAEVRADHTAGEVGDRAFRVRMARLTAESRALDQRIDRLEAAAAPLSNETRREFGLTAAQFRRLSNETATLEDAESERVFRTYVGSYSFGGVYRPYSDDSLGEYNASKSELDVEIQSIDSQASFYREQYEEVDATAEDSDSEAVQDALECALSHIEAAEEALREARDAAGRGDLDAAQTHLQTARDELEAAAVCLERAREELSGDYQTPTSSYNKTTYEYDGDDN